MSNQNTPIDAPRSGCARFLMIFLGGSTAILALGVSTATGFGVHAMSNQLGAGSWIGWGVTAGLASVAFICSFVASAFGFSILYPDKTNDRERAFWAILVGAFTMFMAAQMAIPICLFVGGAMAVSYAILSPAAAGATVGLVPLLAGVAFFAVWFMGDEMNNES